MMSSVPIPMYMRSSVDRVVVSGLPGRAPDRTRINARDELLPLIESFGIKHL